MTDATTASTPSTHWTLTLVCHDQPGIVHAISGAVVQAGGNITESAQFSSHDTGTFFMRLQVEAPGERDAFESALAPVVAHYGMTHRLDVVGRPTRTLVLASKAAHCVNDLLFRQRAGQLPIEVPLILANHDDLSGLAEFYGKRFEHHPVTDPASKAAFEARVLQVVDRYDIELVLEIGRASCRERV